MNLEKLCQKVVLVAREAGAFIKTEFHAFDKSKIVRLAAPIALG